MLVVQKEKADCRVKIKGSNLAEKESGDESESEDESQEENESSNVAQTIESSFSVKNNKSTLMNIEGYINNKKVTCCIDTGASSSIMSKDTALSIGLFIEPCDTRVRLADGSIATVAGITKEVSVFIKKIFLILP